MDSSQEIVKVFLRIRPLSKHNLLSTSSLEIISKDPPVLCLIDKAQTYHFDKIFTEVTDQELIYNVMVKPLVQNVKSGYNSTVFAYGQTGTGKTYTIGTNPNVIQDADDNGLILRALSDFLMNSIDDIYTEIHISFVEIYNEKVYDLLDEYSMGPLQVKGFSVQGFRKERIFNMADAEGYLRAGSKRRHVGETKQNSNSSRSHAIFTIYCRVYHSDHETCAKLNLVDLAGSESIRKTGNEGSSRHEGININKGLLCLGQVMTALANNSAHIPYRQSIITTILKDSLSRKNFVSLIACISSNNEDTCETQQTLDFAARVKRVKNRPEVNQVISQYKKDNPVLFRGVTPFKRSQYETPLKKVKLSMNTIVEPNGVSNFDDTRPSASSTTSTYLESNPQFNFSPMIQKHINAMEISLMNKLKDVIVNTLKRPERTSLRRINRADKENCTTPSISLDKITKVVRSEILQMTGNILRPTSSTISSAKDIFTEKQTNYPTGAKKVLTYDSPNEPMCIEDDTTFKIPFLMPKPLNGKSPAVPGRNVIRLEAKSPRRNEVKSRRSVRLQQKRHSICCGDTIKPAVHSKSKVGPKIIQYSPTTRRLKEVLQLLNKGTIKELTKLQTVGAKTAEKIVLYREIKGNFKSIEDISGLFTKTKYNKFLSENFITCQ